MATSVCVDPLDFRVEAGTGRLQKEAAFLQTVEDDWTFLLTEADGVWEPIPQMNSLNIPYDGRWAVSFDAAGFVGTVVSGSSVSDINISASVFKNGVLLPGTETRVAYLRKALGTAAPLLETGGTGSLTFRIYNFVAGDVLSLYGARFFNGTVEGRFTSNSQGRSRLQVYRIGPS